MSSEPKAHPAASILSEIAEEASRNPEFWSAFEVWGPSEIWYIPCNLESLAYSVQCGRPVRRRPRTVEINGWQVPEPVREPPEIGTLYWITSVAREDYLVPGSWDGDSFDFAKLRRGVVHLTTEAAEAHGRALASFTSREDEG